MQKLQKILSLLLVLLLLTGCAGPVQQTDPTDGTTDSAVTTDPTQTESSNIIDLPVCSGHDGDPYANMTAEEFYADYTPACCYEDANYRSRHYFLSGSLEVPGQYAVVSEYQPQTADGLLIRNTDCFYEDDGRTYVVVDCYGQEVMRIYQCGAYITLEEVAAFMYAFGGKVDNLPANYTSKKTTNASNSPWGKYLRSNHSHFSGNTNKYPYEPELPDIKGCGGKLQYWELDIGTTGTTTPGYAPKPYNEGGSISRGAARLVYGRQDLNGNGKFEENEVYVFYTFNHYNDFMEYLNYYGGWGEVFGNVTGGGEYSSKTNCNPTPYVPTGYASFFELYAMEDAA